MNKIAVLITCFNRKDKTLSCLRTLFQVSTNYNYRRDDKVDLTVFLTDDGCTDGTADSVKSEFPNERISITRSCGNLFWSGGMRLAWNCALKENENWDFYLLLNDDVDLLDNLFDELMEAHRYSLDVYGLPGIYSGITSAKINKNLMTYGGSKWTLKLMGMAQRLEPIGKPQLCDLTNANILLVSSEVVKKNGIFWDGYTHGKADYDYSLQAKKNGFPVLVTSNFCGRCDNDHRNSKEEKDFIISMSLSERKKYFSNPLHSNKDYLSFIKRNVPSRYLFVYIGRKMIEYFPRIYYFLGGLRTK